jgi:hypothetical protein
MRRPLLAAAVALVISGCGSTIEMGSSPTGGSQAIVGEAPAPSGDGLSIPTATQPPDSTDGTDGTGAPDALGGVSTPTGSSVVANSAHPPRRHGSGQPTSPASASAGSPTDHTPIRVGLLYGKDVGAAAALVGITGLSTGDTLAQSQAVVRWVNAHGGVGGHPIQLTSYGINASAGGDPDATYQAACTALTQDQHIRYLVTMLTLRPASMPCFAKAGVGVLDDEAGVGDAQRATFSKDLAGPGDFGLGRSVTNLVDDLVRRGWLTSKNKIGALTYDDPQLKPVISGPLVRALRAHGLHLSAAAAIPNTTAYFTAVGGVVLKFRAAGVDRVIPIGASPLSMMISASTQGYHPAYAVVSGFGPGALLEGAAPKDQLVNSAGIGWQPFLDIGKGKHPGPVSQNETLCFKLMKGAGQASTSATTRGFQAQVCDLFFYLKRMGDALPTLPSDLFSAARPIIANTFRSSATFRSDMRQHSDGVAAYRDLAYEQGCKCYQYVSQIRRTTS